MSRKKLGRFLAIGVVVAMTVVGTNTAFAEEFTEQMQEEFVEQIQEEFTQQSQEEVIEEIQFSDEVVPVEIQCVDENGNITYIIDDQSPVVDGIALFANESDSVVNLRANSSGQVVTDTTKFIEKATGNEGYLYGHMGADAAYLGMENGKVKFMVSGVVGLVNASNVQVVSRSQTSSISYYYTDGTWIYHSICTNLNSTNTSLLKVGPKQSYLATGTKYYSYDGHYFYTNYATMISDYMAGIRTNSVNPSNPYYNYYQFLPLRSTTNYTAAQLDSLLLSKTASTSKMRNIGSIMVNNQNTYGINALLATSIAANESGWGISSIATSKNNLFGLNAVDSSPGQSADSFSSVESCIIDFMKNWMSKGYLNTSDWRYRGGFLGNKASGINVKYASDPYWGEKAAAIAWNLDGQALDRNKYTIGIKDTVPNTPVTLNVRKESTTTSAVLFQTSIANCPFIILGEENGFYKIQSDALLNSNRTAIDLSTGVYNFSKMYAYVSKDYVTALSQGSGNAASQVGDTLVVRRGNTYYFKYSLTAGEADLLVTYGRATDEVLVGDWNGDGMDTLCVRRGNTYYFKNSLTPGEADYIMVYGYASDEVYVGDWNGDGKDTICVRRGNTYYFKNDFNSGVADQIVTYGKSTDSVLVGDWDGDGKDTLAVRRGSIYYIKNSLANGEADKAISYGYASDEVLVGDWNGDGTDTLCVRRGSQYHMKNSISAGIADVIINYGRTNDVTYAGKWK
jgi:beta-N-acetylglucosaminidase